MSVTLILFAPCVGFQNDCVLRFIDGEAVVSLVWVEGYMLWDCGNLKLFGWIDVLEAEVGVDWNVP